MLGRQVPWLFFDADNAAAVIGWCVLGCRSAGVGVTHKSGEGGLTERDVVVVLGPGAGS